MNKYTLEKYRFDYEYKQLLMKIGNNLKNHRTSSALTLQQVSDNTNIDIHVLRATEQGINIDYNLGLLVKLAKTYDIDVEQLF